MLFAPAQQPHFLRFYPKIDDHLFIFKENTKVNYVWGSTVVRDTDNLTHSLIADDILTCEIDSS